MAGDSAWAALNGSVGPPGTMGPPGRDAPPAAALPSHVKPGVRELDRYPVGRAVLRDALLRLQPHSSPQMNPLAFLARVAQVAAGRGDLYASLLAVLQDRMDLVREPMDTTGLVNITIDWLGPCEEHEDCRASLSLAIACGDRNDYRVPVSAPGVASARVFTCSACRSHGIHAAPTQERDGLLLCDAHAGAHDRGDGRRYARAEMAERSSGCAPAPKPEPSPEEAWRNHARDMARPRGP